MGGGSTTVQRPRRGPEGKRGKRGHPDDRVSQGVTNRPLKVGLVCQEPCRDRWLLSQEGDTGPLDYMRWPPAGGPGLGPGSGPQGTSANRGGGAGLAGAPCGLALTAPGSACLQWSLSVGPVEPRAGLESAEQRAAPQAAERDGPPPASSAVPSQDGWHLRAPAGGRAGGQGADDDSDFQAGCQWIRMSARRRGSEDQGGP